MFNLVKLSSEPLYCNTFLGKNTIKIEGKIPTDALYLEFKEKAAAGATTRTTAFKTYIDNKDTGMGNF